MKTIIAIATTLMIAGCGGMNNNKPMNTLPDIVQVGHSILSRDTTELNGFPTLTSEQCLALHNQTKCDVPAGSQLIGERSVNNGMSLSAYRIPLGEEPNHFKVFLVIRDNKDKIIDFIDLHEFHTSEHKMPLRFGGNRFYTTDATLIFDDDQHFTLHRMMTLTSLFLKDHKLTEMWRVEWDNHYEIDEKGHFIFKSQQETHRTPNDLDDPMINEFKARDLQ